MYYASGNYEAFARPKKPEGVDQKSAYIRRQRSGSPYSSVLPGA